MQQKQTECDLSVPQILQSLPLDPVNYHAMVDFSQECQPVEVAIPSRRASLGQVGSSKDQPKFAEVLFKHEEFAPPDNSAAINDILTDVRTLKKVNSAENRLRLQQVKDIAQLVGPLVPELHRESHEKLESFNSQPKLEGQISLDPKPIVRATRSSLPATVQPIKAKSRMAPQQPYKSDVFPNLMANKQYQGVPLRQAAYPTIPSSKNAVRNFATKASTKVNQKSEKLNSNIAAELNQSLSQHIGSGNDKKSRASIQVISKTTENSTAIQSQKPQDYPANDLAWIENRQKPLRLEDSHHTETQVYQRSVERLSTPLEEMPLQDPESSAKDLEVRASKQKLLSNSIKPQPKERIYADNYLEAQTSLKAGIRFTAAGSANLQNKKPQKRKNNTVANLDVTTEVYMQYTKIASNLQTNSNLVAQLLAKPQVIAPKQKVKRQLVEKKPQTDWTSPVNKETPFLQAEKIKGSSKDTRLTTAGFNRDSSISQKEPQDYGRNKSVNFPSYFKGGSAAQERRQAAGLKEAAIQMMGMENRLTKTSVQSRIQNVSPINSYPQQQLLSQDTQTNLKTNKALAKRKKPSIESASLAKTGTQSINQNQAEKFLNLENFYREKKVKQTATEDARAPKDLYNDFTQQVEMPGDFQADFDRIIMPVTTDEADHRRSHSQKSGSRRNVQQVKSPHWNSPKSLIEDVPVHAKCNSLYEKVKPEIETDQPILKMIESTDTIKHFSNIHKMDAKHQTEAYPSPKDAYATKIQGCKTATGSVMELELKAQTSHVLRSPTQKERVKGKETTNLKKQQEVLKKQEGTYSPIRSGGYHGKNMNSAADGNKVVSNYAIMTPAPLKKFTNLHQVIQEQFVLRKAPEMLNQNIPSHFYLKPSDTQRGRQFKYQVLSGNNGALVKRVMQETRSNLWIELQNSQVSHFHFRWTPVSRQINFERISHNFVQMVNHVEGHHEITTKNELFKNVKNYFDERNLNSFHVMPITFYIKVSSDKNDGTLKKQLAPFKQVFNLLEEFKNLFDSEQSRFVAPPPKSPQVLTEGTATEDTPKKKKSKKSNQIQSSPQRQRFMAHLLDDQTQVQTFRDVQKAMIDKPCQILITRKGRENDYQNGEVLKSMKGKVKRFTSKSSGLVMPINHFTGKNVWILKPTSYNRGKGIHVVSDLKKLKKLMKEYSGGGREASVMAPILTSAVQMRNQSQAPVPSSSSNKLPWGYNQLQPFKQIPPPLVLNKTVANKSNSLALQHEQKAINIGKPKNNLLKAKVNQSTTMLNAQLLVTGAPMLARSHHFSNPNKPVKTEIQTQEDRIDNVSVRSIEEDLVEGNCEPGIDTKEVNDNKDFDMEQADMQEFETEDFDIIDKAEIQSLEEIKKTEIAGQLNTQPPLLQKSKYEMSIVETQPMIRKEAHVQDHHNRGHAKTGVKTTTFIIQKYIEQPALINGRKFDIRVWVLLDHNKEVYFFEEGYLRLSGYEYSMTHDNLDDDAIHLTNNAIQKNCPNYGAHEDGNQLSFGDMKKWLKTIGRKSSDFENFILPKMKYYAATSLYSARKKLNAAKRKFCFELFGFDYILDSDLNVFLIECNTNPCIEESSKILKRLLPRMLDDMFKLTIDQIYVSSRAADQPPILNTKTSPLKKDVPVEPPIEAGKGSRYHVPGYKDTHNMWEKIATLRSSSVQNPIFVPNPASKYQVSQSEQMIQLVNQYEMRVAKSELVDKLIRRDMAVHASAQVSIPNY